MGRYLKYAEYRESGDEWLGLVPAEWEISKLKFTASIFGRIGFRGYTVSDIVAEGDGAIVLSPSNIDDHNFTLNKKAFLSWEKYYESPEIMVSAGDIVIVKTGSTFGKSAIVKQVEEPMTINPQMALVKNSNLDPRFLCYLLNSKLIKAKIDVNNTGSGMPTMTQENMNGFPIPNPGKNIAIHIADFLDHETAKIDALIDKQQELIKLLKEKRQAVISHAVTKGLNPNAPMRDSGVEWLGEVPEHWKVKRLKHFSKVIGGYAFKSSDFSDTGARAVKISNVSHLSFDWSDSSYLPETFLNSQKEYIAPKNSLIFAMTRPIISGGVKVAKLDLNEDCLVNQRVGFLKPTPEVNQDYLMYVAQSESFYHAFQNNCTITNQPNISAEGIEDIHFACPDLLEQQKVVGFIELRLLVIENAISKGKMQVELLAERRTALISAAVTGKIDLRNWEPANK